jgi:hypothetical protein
MINQSRKVKDSTCTNPFDLQPISCALPMVRLDLTILTHPETVPLLKFSRAGSMQTSVTFK